MFDADGRLAPDLPREACLALYRIGQESLRNVARHSGARRAEVSLVGCGRDVMLTVIDNGNTFEVLMDAVRGCSLGQITHTLYDVGGRYRRNM